MAFSWSEADATSFPSSEALQEVTKPPCGADHCNTHTHTHRDTHTHRHTQTHTHKHTHTHTHTHTQTHTHKHTQTHTDTHTHIHALADAFLMADSCGVQAV